MYKIKYIISLFALLAAVLCTGCSGSRPLQYGYSIPGSELIGSWRTDYNLNSKRGILTFKPDSTFTDSVFNITADSLKLIPELVVKGSCYVDGPIIRIKDAAVIYSGPGSPESRYKYIDNLSGFLSEGTLFLQPVFELEPGGVFEPSLAGEWITKRWICTYNKNLQPQINDGFVKESYDFDTTSMKCRISKDYLFESSPAVNDTVVDYVQKDRELVLDSNAKKWIVFYQNKMYWFNQNYYRYNKIEADKTFRK